MMDEVFEVICHTDLREVHVRKCEGSGERRNLEVTLMKFGRSKVVVLKRKKDLKDSSKVIVDICRSLSINLGCEI